MNSESISQNSTRIPDDSLRIAVQLIERGKVDASQVLIQDSLIKLLNKKLVAKDKQIFSFTGREVSYKNLIAKYKKESGLKDQSAKISTEWISGLRKDLKRSRTKTVMVGIAGLVVSGITLYLATK